ncbi:MAG: sulfotransferase domain-containing protein [Pseudomonadales bacterium]
MLPQVTRTYKNHHLDSSRWDLYRPRSNDVIIATAYKSGTTWTQNIFYELLYGDETQKPSPDSVNVWPDADFRGLKRDALKTWLDGFEAQRYIKSHIPLDGLPYYEQVKYVIVCRDPRDVFMSLFNHVSRYTPEFYQMLNDPARLVGQPMPKISSDPREVWRQWISKGWFDWETEGYPMWSNMHHTQTFWNFKHLPNFLFLHYNDMLSDLSGAVAKLAAFSGIEVDRQKIARVVEATTFEKVKQKALALKNDRMASTFEGGQAQFIFKGTNGRWKDIFTDQDLDLYEAAKQRVLSEDCARWLEQGGIAA